MLTAPAVTKMSPALPDASSNDDVVTFPPPEMSSFPVLMDIVPALPASKVLLEMLPLPPKTSALVLIVIAPALPLAEVSVVTCALLMMVKLPADRLMLPASPAPWD